MKIVYNISFLICLAYAACLPLIAQNETKIWYFTSNAGLDFSSNPPIALSNGSLNTGEGSASISDANGTILFYTNGLTIWDKTHSVMANGSGLFGGGGSTSQAALIVKKPGSSNLFYVFTNEAQNGYNYGLHYSIVDVSLASGNGSVTIKNVTVFNNTTEKLCATWHANGTDVWILTHEFNSNNFKAYLLTAAGISTTAINSAVGSVHSSYGAVGCMKISPDQKKIGLAIYDSNANGSYELYDFNKNGGQVSNPVILGSTFTEPYGCAFSADGKKFYGGNATDGKIRQWDLCDGSTSAIIASQLAISTSSSNGVGALQLGLDGKIYVARIGAQFLGVINDPNLAGAGCNYIELGQSIAPKVCAYGLPNFIDAYFWSGPSVTITYAGSLSLCAGETKTLMVNGASTYTWNGATQGNTLFISPLVTSSYTVVGTMTTGCNYSSQITVTVSACTGQEELTNFFGIIYPNPFKEKISLDLPENVSITLIDAQGIKLFSQNLPLGKSEINLSDLPNGIYYIKLKHGLERDYCKILVKE